MKIHRSLLVIAIVTLALLPAPAANKDMVQLQTQMQAIQDQMARMQQSFDERMGVMKNLMDQNTDSINKVTASIAAMQDALQKQQASGSGQLDQLSGQIQSLNDSLDELKARLNKVSKQLEDMQSAQQTVAANQAQAAAAPPPDVLYNNALRDYNAGKNDLSVQEFSDYIKFYPNTDLAGNSYFYLAEIEFKQANYQEAVKNYDLVIQNYPGGNKAPSAELKKGYAQIELGQKDDGVASLRHVIQRYPRSNEASQARERLRKLGVSTTARQ